MTRLALAVAAVACAALAVHWAPPPPASGGDPLTALGQSVGGLRVAAIDVAFIRAERLRRAGLVDELPALYDVVRRLDPKNAAAADHLAAIYAYDLMSDAPDTAARFSWWREAWSLVEAALRDHPMDGSLLMRSSDLLLDVAPRDPGLEDRVEALVPRHRHLGIRQLLRAARATSTLPRRGRMHLVRLALLLPVVAAAELGAGDDGWRSLVGEGRAVLALHRSVFAEVRLPSDVPGEGPRLDRVFEERLDVVESVAGALEGGRRAGAEATALVAAWRDRNPDSALADALESALETE